MIEQAQTPKKRIRTTGKSGGKKSLSGGGLSPVLRVVVTPALLDKFHQRGGAPWLRKLMEAS